MQVVNHGTVCWFEEESPAWDSDGSLRRVNGRYCVWREDSKAALLLYIVCESKEFLQNKAFSCLFK